MKHRRGIDLNPANDQADYVGMAQELEFLSFDKLRDWHTLGGYCTKCERTGWIDRWALQRRYGDRCMLSFLTRFLRCRRCGNKGNNRFIIGKHVR